MTSSRNQLRWVTHMGSRTELGYLLTLICVLVAMGACASTDDTAAADSTAVTAATTTSATASPTTDAETSTTTTQGLGTSTTLGPISYPGGATYVTGRISNFTLTDGTVTSNEEGTTSSRDGTIAYTLISNDTRVSGTVTGTWHSDRWGTPTEGAAITQWGEATITNEDGTWEATYDGIWTSTLGDVITRWWQGTGDYEGLTFYMAATGQSAWEWVGLVYPGAPPPRT